jgi:hypothetical protein
MSVERALQGVLHCYLRSQQHQGFPAGNLWCWRSLEKR